MTDNEIPKYYLLKFLLSSKLVELKAWGFGSVEAARNFANRNKKS